MVIIIKEESNIMNSLIHINGNKVEWKQMNNIYSKISIHIYNRQTW